MMSSIDRDALREAVDGVLSDWPFAPPDSAARNWTQTDAVLDAILPAVEQAIRAARADEREQAAQAIEAYGQEKAPRPNVAGAVVLIVEHAARLARGGSTDE